jgi:dipeptidase
MRFNAYRFFRFGCPPFLAVLAVGLILSPSRGTETEFGFFGQRSCTSIMVGRLATADGSVFTSHTCDGTYRTWVEISPHRKNDAGTKNTIFSGRMGTRMPDDERGLKLTGEIPEVAESYSFFNTAYPAMNEHQLGMGETTVVGRIKLRNPQGVFRIEEIQRLMLERCTTAREAIHLADELTKTYGYIDYGECLTIADKKEVWHFEILGATKKYIGAVWAAVRIPDDHVGVSANCLRIGEIDLKNPDYYMASENVYSLAAEMGWWDPKGNEPFKFYKAYSKQKTNYWPYREWRVLSLAAPSLNLDPKAEELPFSVKAERKLSVRDIMAWFRDTYENTPFDCTPKILVKNRLDPKGNLVQSPVVSPWMSAHMAILLNSLKPDSAPMHYTIANNSTSYSTVIQCRAWLPDPIGGIVWLGFDNPAQTARIPLFCGIAELPPSFKFGNQNGFTTESAAWAFRRAARLAQLGWGKTRKMVEGLISDIEGRAFDEIPMIEKKALELYPENPDKARAFITAYCRDFALAVTERYWDLGDELWADFVSEFQPSPEEFGKLRDSILQVFLQGVRQIKWL